SIAVAASGNIYVIGSFKGTPDFDPGPGNFYITASGMTQHVYISKFDNAGNYIWTKAYIGTYISYGPAIKVDAAENIYNVVHFFCTLDFDFGPGDFSITNPSFGVHCKFITKMDANGSVLWAKNIQSSIASNRCRGIALDPSGNIYVAGGFHSITDFDPGPGT